MPSAGAVVITVALGLGTVHAAFAGAPSAERQADLLNLVQQDCGSCHGLTMNGGLGPKLLPETLNGKNDEGLAAIVLDGVPETPMPPWRFELTPDEALWIVWRLKSGLLR